MTRSRRSRWPARSRADAPFGQRRPQRARPTPFDPVEPADRRRIRCCRRSRSVPSSHDSAAASRPGASRAGAVVLTVVVAALAAAVLVVSVAILRSSDPTAPPAGGAGRRRRRSRGGGPVEHDVTRRRSRWTRCRPCPASGPPRRDGRATTAHTTGHPSAARDARGRRPRPLRRRAGTRRRTRRPARPARPGRPFRPGRARSRPARGSRYRGPGCSGRCFYLEVVLTGSRPASTSCSASTPSRRRAVDHHDRATDLPHGVLGPRTTRRSTRRGRPQPVSGSSPL